MFYTSIPSSDQTFIAQTRKGDKVQCKTSKTSKTSSTSFGMSHLQEQLEQ
jgi:uncharacterized Zn-binding protein involved in type VI secretion